jgi:hypothetical protein
VVILNGLLLCWLFQKQARELPSEVASAGIGRLFFEKIGS